ncbi:EAL domain-containing protein [Lacticaseibacillus porcinae]|uniref:EAL domain-containing protein n=1 Tax=Lacticaseibacillus porcinae TaxID=1123687 RepID=UPI000F774991|nr:EAL domain-containing protein [Lacticaseibacillus porcinae]
MIRFWGQPKYAQAERFALELFLREKIGDQWTFPQDFGRFNAKDITTLLQQTVAAVPKAIQMVSINLDQPEFARADYLKALPQLQAQLPEMQLCVELTERPNGVAISALVAAAKVYQAGGLWVCIDDVGTGDNQPELVQALAPYVQEYKFALQNFHDQKDFITLVSPLLQFWREQAQLAGVFFAIEGFENKADLKIATNYQPDIMQGYYFGRPQLIDVS